jgi:hypothetical protein
MYLVRGPLGLNVRNGVIYVQRFVAELSTEIEAAKFDKAWRDGQSPNQTKPNVDFAFVGRRVSAVINSDSSDRWPSTSFHQTFSAAIRSIDGACNVRWL